MNLHIKKHLWYYLSLFWVMALALLAAYILSYNKNLQLAALFTAAGFYASWGIAHQYIHHHVTPKIVIEYVLIGSLGCILSLLIVQF